MNLQTLRRVKIALLCLVLACVACVCSFSRFASQAQTRTGRDALKEFAAYKTWTRVNETARRVNNFTIDGEDA